MRKKDDEENKKDKEDENKEEKKTIVGSFLGGIPMLGDLFKELGKTEVFKEKFKEVDEKIKENLKKGGEKKWGIETNISIKPIIKEVKKDATEISIKEDYFYGKKGNKLTLAVKAPKDVDLEIIGKNLLLTSKNFEKKIELPDYYKDIKKKKYKKGILILELTK